MIRSTRVGVEPGSHGLLHIGRGSKLWTTSREGRGWLATFIGDLGTGELLVNEGGQLRADDILCIGASPLAGQPGSSTALVTGVDSHIYTWHLRIGDGHDGSVEVTQGAKLVAEYSIKIGGMASRKGELLITNGGDVAVIRPPVQPGLHAAWIGYSGTGIVKVRLGSQFLVGGRVSMGMEALSTGELLIDGASTFTAEDLYLAPGFEATARVNVRGAGSQLVVKRLIVGSPESKLATVTIGADGKLLVASTLEIAGVGRVTVRSGDISCGQLENAGELIVEDAKLSGDLRCTENATLATIVSMESKACLRVNGTADLAGTLRVVVLDKHQGIENPIPLITATSIKGDFSRIEFDPSIEGARVETSPTSVTLVFD